MKKRKQMKTVQIRIRIQILIPINLQTQKHQMINHHTMMTLQMIQIIPANELERWAKLQAEQFRFPVMRTFHTELEAVFEEFNISQDSNGDHFALPRQVTKGVFAQSHVKSVPVCHQPQWNQHDQHQHQPWQQQAMATNSNNNCGSTTTTV